MNQCLPSQHGFINKGYFKGRICEIICVYNNRCTVLVGTSTFVIPMEFIIFYDVNTDQIIENKIDRVKLEVIEALTEDLSSVSINQSIGVTPRKRKLEVIEVDFLGSSPEKSSIADILTKKIARMGVRE